MTCNVEGAWLLGFPQDLRQSQVSYPDGLAAMMIVPLNHWFPIKKLGWLEDASERSAGVVKLIRDNHGHLFSKLNSLFWYRCGCTYLTVFALFK